jgi:hypothetical protein
MRMQIPIRITGRWRGREDVAQIFEKYALRIKSTMAMLREHYRFRPPRKLPIRTPIGRAVFFGRTNWHPDMGFEIVMNPEECLRMWDQGMWVVDHECCHIVNALAHEYWGHGEQFQEVFDKCFDYIKASARHAEMAQQPERVSKGRVHFAAAGSSSK